MNDTERTGFFSRWSKLKAEQRTPDAPPASLAPPVPKAQPLPQSPPTDAAQATLGQETPAPTGPTLADVADLTSASDFRPFVARHVAPAVKNAAFKKLFADPHFNIMDGLDIYIDDYSQASPLLPEDLKQMVAAKFMKLVEDDPTPTTPAESSAQEDESKAPLALDNKAQAAIEIDKVTLYEPNQPTSLDKQA